MSDSRNDWTSSQLTALKRRGNTLVSAAAGSGKTTVMTEKIVSLLLEGKARLSEMVVVTFTRAAAAQLREKIRKRLYEAVAAGNACAAEHLAELPLAEIGTIHTFCSKIIRENFGLLGVPADYAIVDEDSSKILVSKAINDAMDDLFAEPSTGGEDGISFVCDVIGEARDPAKAAETIVRLYDKLRGAGFDEKKLLEYADRLDEFAEVDFLSTPWGEAVLEIASAMAEHYADVFKELLEGLEGTGKPMEAYGPAVRDMLDYFVLLRKALEEKNYGRTKELLECVPKGRLASLKGENQTDDSLLVKDARPRAVGDAEKFGKMFFSYTPEQITDSMKRTARLLRSLEHALSVYEEKYTAIKKRQGKLDFQDLETLARRLLVGEDGRPTEAALRLGGKYKFIFVDEYQDTNTVQDEIFRAVGAGSERFMVGDIKQSVYRFRGAEPEVFAGYRMDWPTVPDGDESEDGPRDAGVFMSDNFRCSKPVVRFVNRVSEYIFKDGDVPFGDEDLLRAGTSSEVTDPVEIHLLESGQEGPSEEEFIAKRIKEMIGTDPFRTGPLKPSDFAIIHRSAKSKAKGYVDALKKYGIPSVSAAGTSIAEEPDTQFIMDLLRTVDNPHRDVSLANVMMSTMFSFSLDEMTTIRLKFGGGSLFSSVLRMSEEGEGELRDRCVSLRDTIRRFRETERSLCASVFIERLFEETGMLRIPEIAGTEGGEERARAVLDMARQYEKNAYGGLYGFLRYYDDLVAGEGATYNPSGSDSVKILTVHGAKGLEFAVCFFCGTGADIKKEKKETQLVWGKDLGCAVMLPDPGGLVRYDTPLMNAVKEQERILGRYEELRLIYVAMTRAVHKLIIVAKPSHRKKVQSVLDGAKYNLRFRSRHAIWNMTAEIDYILASLEGWRDDCYTLDTVVLPDKEEGEPAEEETAAAAGDGPSADPEKVAALVDSAEKRFAAQYPYSFLSGIPSKLSVSRLYPDVLSPEDGVADLEEEEEEEEKRDGPMPVPSFMTGSLPVTGRERGVATHGFLQFADFARLGTCRTEDEIARLTENGFISERDAGLVSVPDVEKFKKSPLFRRIAGARRVWREFRFNVLLPAEKFTSDPERAAKFAAEDVKITVQGVFDCVFEDADGKLVVADYKTDYMSREDRADPGAWVAKLRERHALQLRYYREAATLLFGREPDEVLIYALALGDTVDMKDA